MAMKLLNVNIEGVTLPMTVATTEDERIYRQAASLINTKLRTMRERYPSLPNDKYYYSMVLLNTTVEVLRAENKADFGPMLTLINELEAEIDKVTKG